MSPMCQYSAVDGLPNEWHSTHYLSRAIGGIGLIIQEATAVVPEGRISYADLGLWNNEQMLAYKILTAQIEAYGAVPGIQIAHAGRKASCEVSWKKGHQIKEGAHSWQTVAPSPIPFHPTDDTPKELSIQEIKEIIVAFKHTASLALEAGYKVLEIHAAHGYLIHEFYSRISNHRTDEYGGSFENRIRFLIEIVSAIQEIWPSNLPLFVRISATDWLEDEMGWDIADSIELCKILKDKGVDLIDCSTGANVRNATIPVGPLYQVPFASAIKTNAAIMTGAVGMINTIEEATQILEDNSADLIFLGRVLLREPYFANNAAASVNITTEWAQQYERAKIS